MSASDELFTLAELSVALAGFSALVSVIANQKGSRHPELDAYSLRALVQVSLITAAFCLFPTVAFKFTDSKEMVWQVSGASFLVARTASTLVFVKRYDAIRHLETQDVRRTRRWLLIPLGIVGSVSLILAAAGGVASLTSSALYYLALCLDLVVAGVLFIEFAQSTMRVPTEVE